MIAMQGSFPNYTFCLFLGLNFHELTLTQELVVGIIDVSERDYGPGQKLMASVVSSCTGSIVT